MRSRLGPVLPLLLALLLGLGMSIVPAVASADQHRGGPRSHSSASDAPGHPRAVPAHSSHRAERALRDVQGMLRSARAGAAQGRAARPVAPRAENLTLALRDLALARPALDRADRRTADALLSRPTTHYAPEVDSEPFPFFDYTSRELGALSRACSARFCVTWTTFVDGGYQNTQTGEVIDNSATLEQARKTLAVLEQVYDAEVGGMGFRPPLSDGPGNGSFDNYDGKIDVYLVNTGRFGYYGYCTSDETSTGNRRPGYCVLDNDFADFPATPDASLQVTAAHEFFHVIQFGYDFSEDKWLMEGSAAWVEDEVYDAIDDYLQYVRVSPIKHPRVPVDYTDARATNPYGAFTFFKFLGGYLNSATAVREVWDAVQATPAGTPGLYSLQGVSKVLRAHHRSVPKAFARFGVWNTLPKRSYPERGKYGKPTYLKKKTLRAHGHRSRVKVHPRLQHLANAPVMLKPSGSLGRKALLRIKIDAPARRHGSAATVQIRYRSGKVKVRNVHLNKRGNGKRTVRFDPRRVSRVVVVMTNGSTRMQACSGVRSGRYSCGGYGVDVGRFVLKAKVRRG